jgi:hypothetical protein
MGHSWISVARVPTGCLRHPFPGREHEDEQETERDGRHRGRWACCAGAGRRVREERGARGLPGQSQGRPAAGAGQGGLRRDRGAHGQLDRDRGHRRSGGQAAGQGLRGQAQAQPPRRDRPAVRRAHPAVRRQLRELSPVLGRHVRRPRRQRRQAPDPLSGAAQARPRPPRHRQGGGHRPDGQRRADPGPQGHRQRARPARRGTPLGPVLGDAARARVDHARTGSSPAALLRRQLRQEHRRRQDGHAAGQLDRAVVRGGLQSRRLRLHLHTGQPAVAQEPA